jgi:hypothetical protein
MLPLARLQEYLRYKACQHLVGSGDTHSLP